jgi:hypothetical protein
MSSDIDAFVPGELLHQLDRDGRPARGATGSGGGDRAASRRPYPPAYTRRRAPGRRSTGGRRGNRHIVKAVLLRRESVLPESDHRVRERHPAPTDGARLRTPSGDSDAAAGEVYVGAAQLSKLACAKARALEDSAMGGEPVEDRLERRRSSLDLLLRHVRDVVIAVRCRVGRDAGVVQVLPHHREVLTHGGAGRAAGGRRSGLLRLDPSADVARCDLLPDHRPKLPEAGNRLAAPPAQCVPDALTQALVVLATSTASADRAWAQLRLGEALALMPKDVGAKAGTVRVLRGTGDRARTVGLDPGAMAVLERWLDKPRRANASSRCRRSCAVRRPHACRVVRLSDRRPLGERLEDSIPACFWRRTGAVHEDRSDPQSATWPAKRRQAPSRAPTTTACSPSSRRRLRTAARTGQVDQAAGSVRPAVSLRSQRNALPTPRHCGQTSPEKHPWTISPFGR